MKAKVLWSLQVEKYVRSKGPEPRRALWREVKALAEWNGQEDPSRIRHLEDDLSGYSRIRCKGERVIFRQDFEAGGRVIKCLYAGERKTIYETFQELLL